MPAVCCIGEALIDMICTDTGKPLQDGEHFLKRAGGAPTNVAAVIAALGGQAQLLAKVGADPFGEHLAALLADFGVHTRYLLRDADHFTTLAFVSLMENGERDFHFSRGADAWLTEAEVEAADLSGVSIVHFGSATAFLPGPLQAAYRRLLQRAQEAGIAVSFDPNYRQLLFGHQSASFIAQSRYFLERCDFFKMSAEEALLITGRRSVEEAAQALLDTTKAVFTLTLGKEGALLGLKGALYPVPGVPAVAVDSTGAGDAFVGSVLYQLSRYPSFMQWPTDAAGWQQMVQEANAAGALTCAHMGAMEAFRQLKRR